MRRVIVAIVAIALTGCANSATHNCGDVTCPSTTHCGPMNECVPDSCGAGQFLPSLEACDGDDSIDTATMRCTDFGFYKGERLTCSETCSIDTSLCSESCGDHVINGPERCDGVPATGAVCADFGFDIGTVGCTDACTPAFDYCTNIGWQLVPGGATDELYALYLAAPDSGVAVGRAGQIVAAQDGVWIPIASPTTQDLNGVIGGNGVVIAVGNGGTILRFDGTAITSMPSPTSENLLDVSGTPSNALAVGDNGTILRFDGATWTTMTSPAAGVRLHAVHLTDSGTAYAAGVNGTVLKLQSGSWTALSITGLPNKPATTIPVDLFDVFVVAQAVFVAGEQTTLARIVNDTTAILPLAKPIDLDTTVPMQTIWGSSPDNVFVAGGLGTLLHWNGSYLSKQDTPTNRTIFDIDAAGQRIIGVTRGGSVIAFNGTSRHVTPIPFGNEVHAIYTDNTQSVAAGIESIWRLGANGIWQKQATLTLQLRSVFALGTNVWAAHPFVGAQQGLYLSTDGAAPTRVLQTGVNDVWGTAVPRRVIAVGDKVWESSDGITFPNPAGAPSTTVNGSNTLNRVWAAPDGTWFAVGENGFAMKRGPGATDWTAIPTGVPNTLLGVWGAASDDVFAVGTLGTIVHWDGTTWRRMYTGVAENLHSISGNSGQDVFVAGTSFMRLHYDGINWSRMASYGLEVNDLATYQGTTFYVIGAGIERFERVQAPAELGQCSDAFDNDSDGRTNCDDPECVEDVQCRRGGACETLERITCETTNLTTDSFSGVARLADIPCLDHSTPGPEASFRYIAETSGNVTVTIEDATQQLDLVVADAMLGHCVLDTCRAATTSGTTRSVTFPAQANQMYYIVVDGPLASATQFTLSVQCE